MPNPLSRVTSAFASSVYLAITLLLSLPACAVLGQDVSSIRSDRVHMNAEVRIMPGMSYSVHELRIPTGTTVREFVSPAGQVFGVAWQGPYAPDLRQLLGEHFDEFINAMESSERVHRRVVHVETGDLVLELGGHMRFIVGRAYLRGKLPEGASADAIR